MIWKEISSKRRAPYALRKEWMPAREVISLLFALVYSKYLIQNTPTHICFKENKEGNSQEDPAFLPKGRSEKYKGGDKAPYAPLSVDIFYQESNLNTSSFVVSPKSW